MGTTWGCPYQARVLQAASGAGDGREPDHRLLSSTASRASVARPNTRCRDRGPSGLGVSHAGPLGEIHDASTPDETHAALFGFFSRGAERTGAPGMRREKVLRQLSRMFGPRAASPLHYLELDWAGEAYTSTPRDALPLADHPAYGHSAFRRAALHGRVHWAGSEAAPREGGYLEGAVWAGEDAARAILARLGPRD